MPLFKREKTLAEIEEETEKAEAEELLTKRQLSVALNKAEMQKLKDAGLTPKNFNWDLRSIKNWLKTH